MSEWTQGTSGFGPFVSPSAALILSMFASFVMLCTLPTCPSEEEKEALITHMVACSCMVFTAGHWLAANFTGPPYEYMYIVWGVCVAWYIFTFKSWYTTTFPKESGADAKEKEKKADEKSEPPKAIEK
eukprot:TRINITY_DN30200_c0_g3_i1.p2 TRINITY_DN30200_c0_g3~~TRINITY_DN30200_c0_g3_i1.p2  ORF type:complete len:128 (-),score=20.81 TRINITY_DN30200_c0_g3_i1:117-500(-)